MKSCKDCIHYVVCSDIAEKFIEAFSSGKNVADVCKNFDKKIEIVKCKECKHCEKNQPVISVMTPEIDILKGLKFKQMISVLTVKRQFRRQTKWRQSS